MACLLEKPVVNEQLIEQIERCVEQVRGVWPAG